MHRSLMLLLLFAPALGLSQVPQTVAQSTADQAPPIYKAHVRDVVVDVVVTRGDGEPVHGLQAKDFAVSEDGQSQAIDYFEEHTSGNIPKSALDTMLAGVYSNAPPAPESDAVNILLLDSLNTEMQDQARVRQQLLHFLKTMQPGTRAAVFLLGTRLHYIQGFTSDTARLIAAMNDNKRGVSPSKDAASRSRADNDDDKQEVWMMIRGLSGHRSEGVDTLESVQANVAGFKYGNRLEITLQALQTLARYLAAVPGRKNLLWFAGSYPVTVFPSAQQKEALAQQRAYSDKRRQTADLLTSSDIAVYPICAQGIVFSHVTDADQPDASNTANHLADYMNERNETAGVQQSMERLAADTGGKAFYNTDDLAGAMQRAIADGSNYYTITYSPTNKKMDGSFRRIQLKLPGTKYKLGYRRGYNAEDTSDSDTTADAGALHELMTPGMPDTTQILFSLRVLPAATQPTANAPRAGKNDKLSGPLKRYDIEFKIRAAELRLDPMPDGKRTGRIEVDVAAYDRDGHPLNWTGAIRVMNLNPNTFAEVQQSGVPAQLGIDLPADKPVDLVAGVFDFETGKTGTLQIRLNP